MNPNDPKEWMQDYSEFLNSSEVQVPQALNQKVLTTVEALLNPSAWTVFAKLLGIHLVVGFFSLAICHQFGLNPFETNLSLAEWFMRYGESACMIGCGIIFVSFSVLAAGIFLTLEELRALKRTEFLQALSLGTTSLLVFALFGAEFALAFAALWLLGALIGGFVATEAAWKWRLRKFTQI